jgi:large subunit ribosomal protein L6
MSRIGNLPVNLPAGVTVKVEPGNIVKVKGPLGELTQKVDPDITVTVAGNVVTVSRPTDQPRHRSLHGLYRALINNMVVGVSTGYTVKQEFVGVGYRAEVKGQVLELSLGYSHEERSQSGTDNDQSRYTTSWNCGCKDKIIEET